MSLQQIAEYNSEFPPVTANGSGMSQSVVQDTSPTKQAVHKYKREDFEIVRLLGSGAFATVVLVRQKSDNRLFAMKIVEKALLSRVITILIQIGKKGSVCVKRTKSTELSITPRNS